MLEKISVFQELTESDLKKINNCATEVDYNEGDLIFSEGDPASNIYFIDSGQVAIFIQKFTAQEEVAKLGPGDYFGEMAFFCQDKRTASAVALADTRLYSLGKAAFMDLVKSERTISDKIDRILAYRQEELLLKENLVDQTGINSENLHICIKGDPSLRETSMHRKKYESMVDKVLPELVPKLEDLMLNRCAYQIFIGFNSGEIRIASVFDPFREEIHPATKLTDNAYLNRHFPVINYAEKAELLKNVYSAIAADSIFAGMPEHFKKLYHAYYETWKPITEEEISATLTRLPTLRQIDNFYLRNFTLGMTRNAIRMQFNCDGTHIVSAKDYQRFINENI